MKRAVIVLVVALFTATCQDSGSLFSPDDLGPPSEATIFDARTVSGNQGFAFQPPLAPDFAIVGFDPTVVTRVEVCELHTTTGDPETCAVEVWTSVEPVPVVDDQYQALWDLDESTQELKTVAKAVDPADVPFYRVQVFVGELRLGYLDLKFLDNGAAKKKVDDEIISVGTSRTIPVNYILNDEAVAEQLGGCDVDEGIIDCDAVLVDSEEGTVVSVFTSGGRLAARAEFDGPLVDGSGNPLFFLLEHLDALTQTPGEPGFPFFARARLFDQEGNLFLQSRTVSRFILCQPEDIVLASELHIFLEIRRHDGNGQTTIVPSDPNTPECGLTQSTAQRSGPAPSWDQRLWSGVARLAGAFVPQPLRALHGGLNTTGGMLCCSEFDAVLVVDEVPFDFATEWSWEVLEDDASGTGTGPFYVNGPELQPGGICNNPNNTEPELSIAGGTAIPSWINNTLSLTKSFVVPSGTQQILVEARFDNDLQIFLNGTNITDQGFGPIGDNPSPTSGQIDGAGFIVHENCAEIYQFTVDVGPNELADEGLNTLNLVVRDRGGVAYAEGRVVFPLPIIE